MLALTGTGGAEVQAAAVLYGVTDLKVMIDSRAPARLQDVTSSWWSSLAPAAASKPPIPSPARDRGRLLADRLGA